MKSNFHHLLLLLLLLPLLPFVSAFWPQPTNIQTGNTTLRLSPSFSIQFDNGRVRGGVPSDLNTAISRTIRNLKSDKLQILVPDRGAGNADAAKRAPQLRRLILSLTSGNSSSTDAAAAATGSSSTRNAIKSISEEAVAPLGTKNEAYTLTIPEDGGDARITADSALGLFRGLTTFEQAWYEIDGMVYTLQAPIDIKDEPKYPYRGFMLDTSRNYFPVTDIKRTLDAMSWVKINHFHWHVVDSQSFPLVVPGFEEISQKGAYSRSQVYTANDVKEIVQYAGERGIDVMVEIDTPGHTAVIGHSHPEHIACFESAPWSQYANEPPAGQLRLASPNTRDFTAQLIKAVASMFPSKLFSTGGDEINQRCYEDDQQTQQDLGGRTIDQALDEFTQTTHSELAQAGKTPVVWEEMVLEHAVKLRNDTIALVWISSDHVGAVAQKGFRLIHAASDFFYLDCGGGGWVGNNIGGNSWCDPFKTWQKAYSFNPTAGVEPGHEDLVMGGQQLLWAEQSGPSNLDSIAWPRAAASAELFWTGPGGDVRTALPRLHDVAYRFVQRGVRAIPLQPQWCALRPNACDIDASAFWTMVKRLQDFEAWTKKMYFKVLYALHKRGVTRLLEKVVGVLGI